MTASVEYTLKIPLCGTGVCTCTLSVLGRLAPILGSSIVMFLATLTVRHLLWMRVGGQWMRALPDLTIENVVE